MATSSRRRRSSPSAGSCWPNPSLNPHPTLPLPLTLTRQLLAAATRELQSRRQGERSQPPQQLQLLQPLQGDRLLQGLQGERRGGTIPRAISREEMRSPAISLLISPRSPRPCLPTWQARNVTFTASLTHNFVDVTNLADAVADATRSEHAA